MKVKFNLPSLFTKVNSEKFKRIGGASIRVEEIITGVNKGALLIMFPPTGYKMEFFSAVKSWLWNFAAWCMPYRDMKRPFLVHAGFMDMYRDVREHMMEAVKEYMGKWSLRCEVEKEKSPEHKIIVTGYSQGAALATIAHEDLFFHGFDVCSIVFASPRVFIGAPSKRFKNLHRINMRGDMVIKVPSWPYAHVGKSYAIGDRCNFWKMKKHFMSEYMVEMTGMNFDEAKDGAK